LFTITQNIQETNKTLQKKIDTRGIMVFLPPT